MAGNGTQGYSGDGGPATQAEINSAVYVATDLYGNLYIADQNNNRIRKVNSAGVITTVAGNGSAGFSGDGGPAAQATLNSPTGVCTDSAGDLYVNDVGNYRVRKIDTSGNITTVAGNGVQGSSGDGGPATQASMWVPIRCAVDSSNNLYIADQSGHKIRKVTPGGIISTFAGTGAGAGPHSIASYSGDGGPATAANLNNPTAVTVDSAGNVYFSDQYNQRIRKVDTTGTITTIAGNGNAGYSGDGGSATAAMLNYPGGLIVDQNGDIYVADDVNNRIRKISQGVITTVAGNGVEGYSGDGGAATQAELNGQFGVALDPPGNLYIADSANARIRKVGSLGAGTTPAITPAGVTNGASFKTGLTPGGLITIFGSNLSNGVVGFASFSQVPLPTTLANSRVLINGSAVPLFYVVNSGEPEQISAQAPFELAGQQSVSLAIDNGRVISQAIQVPVLPAQPGIFLVNSTDGAFLHSADLSLVTAAKPARPGEVIVVFCTGLGAVTPAGTTGALASGTVLTQTNITPSVTIGGTTAAISFSGLAPALVGLYQINLTVPAATSAGNINVVVTANGVSSNPANLHVQ